MEPLRKRYEMKAYMTAILVVGVLRFLLTVSGLPDALVKYFSMTVVILVGVIHLAVVTRSHWERFKASYLLILPYVVVEVAALGYTWVSGHQTIFHAEAYSFGTSIGAHTLGHLVGGFTWEPWGVFVGMEVIWAIGEVIRRRSR